MIRRLWRRLVAFFVSPIHTHPEGAWRPDCAGCAEETHR